MSEYTLEQKRDYAAEKLAAAKDAVAAAERRHEAAHEMGGGIPGFGSSGNQRAAQKVRSALDSAFRADREATERLEYWSTKLAGYERRIAERDRVRFTREDLIGATHVRISRSWHRVVRLNKTTVSVDSGYSWVDRYPFDKVLEHRSIAKAVAEDA